MIIEFIQSYIWCPKNAPQGGPRSTKKEANYQVVDIWLLLRYINIDFASIFENDAYDNAIQIFDGS